MRSAKAIHAEGVSSEVHLRLADRHELTLDLSRSDSADRLAAVWADRMPAERVTVPRNDTHGVFYEAADEQRRSFSARLVQPSSIEDARIPTSEDPGLSIDTSLGRALPARLYVDDDANQVDANVEIAQLGGGDVTFDGQLALDGEPARFHLDTRTPTALGDVAFSFSNSTTWFQGNATTNATDVEVEFQPPVVGIAADAPVTGSMEGAGENASAPAPPEETNHATVNLTGDVPSVSAAFHDLEKLDVNPDAPDGGYVDWRSHRSAPFNLTFHNETWTVDEIVADPLADSGNVTWNTTDGLNASFELSQALDRVRVDLLHAPTEGPSKQVNATLRNVGGDGSVNFDPSDRAYLDVPSGIGSVEVQVLTNVTSPRRLPVLEDSLGMVFEQPDEAAYDLGLAVRLTDVTGLNTTLERPEAGGLRADGTLTLTEGIHDGLRVRANVPQAFVDAQASNLPAETDFLIDTRNRTAEGDKVPLRVDLDWTGGAVAAVDANFTVPEEGQPGEAKLRGDVTASIVRNVTLELAGDPDERMTGHVGGQAAHANASIERGDRRTNVEAHTVDGVYDLEIADGGEAGHVNLVEGTSAVALRLEDKLQGEAATRPNATSFADDEPSFLIRHDSTGYVHARAERLQRADWNSTDARPLDAEIDTAPGLRPAVVSYANGPRYVNATVDNLPSTFTLTVEDRADARIFGVQTSSPTDVPLLTYRNRTPDEDQGVRAQDGTPVATSITARNIDDLDDARITVEDSDGGEGSLSVATDRLDHARLFGVVRGDDHEPGEGAHVFGEVGGVETANATFTFDENAAIGRDIPLIHLDASEPLGQTTVSYESPVASEPRTHSYPDNEHGEYLNLETLPAPDVEAGTSNLTQASLSGLQEARVDPVDEMDVCPACDPLTLALERDAKAPLFVNLNATSVPLRGTLSGYLPARTQLQIGVDDVTVVTPDTQSEQLRRFALDHEASGQIQQLVADVTTRTLDENVRANASIGTLPSDATVEFARDPIPLDGQKNPCGVPLVESLPGSINASSNVAQPIEDIDLGLSPAGADVQPPEPVDGGNFAGILQQDDGWATRLILSKLGDLTYKVGTSSGEPVQLGLSDVVDDLQVQYRNASDDVTVDAQLTGLASGLGLTCEGPELTLQPDGLDATTNGFVLEELSLQAENLTMGDKEANTLNATLESVDGPITVRTVPFRDGEPVPEWDGFQVRGGTGAGAWRLALNVNWDPSTVEPPGHCPGSSRAEGVHETTDVRVEVPIQEVQVALTTDSSYDTPQTPNHVRSISTCDGQVLDLELEHLEDAHFRLTPRPDKCDGQTQLWINVSTRENTDLWLEGYDCGDGETTQRRVEIHPLPNQFWIKSPVPGFGTSFHEREGALFTSSDLIETFRYTKDGCTLVANTYNPQADTKQILTWKQLGRSGLNKADCKTPDVGDGASKVGGFLASGFDTIDRLATKTSDGAQAVEGAWWGVTSRIDESWDLDGFADQRDRPRFTRLNGTFDSHRLEIRDDEEDRGAVWDLSSFVHVDANLQGQWYPSSPTVASDTLVPGTLDLPDSLVQRECLEYNASDGTCEERETWREAKLRIAETYLENRVTFKDEGDWQTFPPRAWVGAIQ